MELQSLIHLKVVSFVFQNVPHVSAHLERYHQAQVQKCYY